MSDKKKRFKRTPDENVPAVSKMVSPFKGVEINGKKFSKSQYEDLCIKAAENIVLAGFNNTEDLKRLVSINGCYNTSFIIDILNKLSETYEDQLLKELDKMTQSPISAANVIGITTKQDMVNITIREYASQILLNIEKKVKKSESVKEDYNEYESED